jgi:hypothetical protein
MLENKEQPPQLSENVVSGSFVKKRYMKCPHIDKKCQWRMAPEHQKGYEYLNGACYLAGSFILECP